MAEHCSRSDWARWLVLTLVPSLGLAEDAPVSYKFGESPVPGLPQSGNWTDVQNWSPSICLRFDGEGSCIEKGYPGQQPANASEFVFHKVTISPTPTIPPGPVPVDATLDLSVMTSVAEVTVGTQATLNVGGQLGLNWYQIPVVGPSPDWKEAVLEVEGKVNVTGKIFSNGIMAITGGGTVELLGGRIEANRLSNVSRLSGAGAITRLGGGDIGFANAGVIEANLDGLALVLDALPSSLIAHNAGQLRASSGGLLRIQGNSPTLPSGVIANSGGIIKALDGSRIELYSLDIRNGELSTAGSGTIEVVGLNVAVRSLANTGWLNVQNGQQLWLGGSITNDGTIRLEATNATTQLRVSGSSPDEYSIGGQGVLSLIHSTRSLVTGAGTTNFGFVNGEQHTIRGAGLIEKIHRIGNRGLIDADASGGILKVVSPTGGTITNSGVARARSGATLELTGFEATNPTQIDNTEGIIQAQDASMVQISYARLTGGTLTTSGSGMIRLPTSVTAIGGLEIAGTVEISGSTTLLGGILTNNGNLLLGTNTAGASLNIDSGAVIAGGGVLTLSNHGSNSIASAGVGTGTLLNGSGHTIQGAGRIGSYGMALTNRGLIQANQSQPLILADSGVAATVTNEGTLRAAAGSTLRIDKNLTNFNPPDRSLVGGRYEVLGTLRLPTPGGIQRNAADLVLDGPASRLYDGGSGTIDALSAFSANAETGRFELRNGRNLAVGTFTNAGTLVLGSGATFSSAEFTQAATGRTKIVIRGAPGIASSAGHLSVTTTAGLGGTLHVHFEPSGSFTPVAGQTWRVMSAAVIGGAFDTITITGLPLGLQGQATIVPGGGVDVSLATRASYTFAQWAGNFDFPHPSQSAPDADPDHDGVINEIEFAFRMDPLLADPGKLPQPTLEGGILFLAFPEPAGITGVTYGGESSTDLVTWLPVADTGAGAMHIFQQSAVGTSRLVMRHRVTLQP